MFYGWRNLTFHRGGVMTAFFCLGEGNRSIDEGSAGRVMIWCAAFKNNTVIGQTSETGECVESH